jgi:hypothetical protein
MGGKFDGQGNTHAFYWQSLSEVILTMNPNNMDTTAWQRLNVTMPKLFKLCRIGDGISGN